MASICISRTPDESAFSYLFLSNLATHGAWHRGSGLIHVLSLCLLQHVLGSLRTLGKVSSLSSPFSSFSEVLYLGHQRAPFWTSGDGSKNRLHTHPSTLSHHAGIKGQRDCLWELALTAVLGKEHHSLGAYKIPNSPPVQKELGSWNREASKPAPFRSTGFDQGP